MKPQGFGSTSIYGAVVAAAIVFTDGRPLGQSFLGCFSDTQIIWYCKMNQILLFVLIISVSAVLSATAQLPPHPVPIVEVDVRDNSIRMRSAELERIKRESEKPIVDLSGKEGEIKFARIKADFESIQKTQNSIVKAFTNEKTIDYASIGDGAKTIRNRAVQLNTNLFGASPEKPEKTNISRTGEQRNVRILIVELDDAIASFVNNEIFRNIRVVDRHASEDAQRNLQEIMKLSDELFKAAKRMKELEKGNPGSR